MYLDEEVVLGVNVMDEVGIALLHLVVHYGLVEIHFGQTFEFAGCSAHSALDILLAVHSSAPDSRLDLLQRGRSDEYIIPVFVFGVYFFSSLDVHIQQTDLILI